MRLGDLVRATGGRCYLIDRERINDTFPFIGTQLRNPTRSGDSVFSGYYAPTSTVTLVARDVIDIDHARAIIALLG